MNFKKVTGRISSLYPVLAYDEDRQVFYLNDSSQTSLGIGMTAEPLSGGDDSVAERLDVLINQDFPENAVLQFSLLASPDIGGFILENERVRLGLPSDSVLNRVLKKKNDFLKECVGNPPDGISSRLRNYVLLITLTLPCRSTQPADEELERSAVYVKTMEQMLSTAGFRVRPMTSEDLLMSLRPFFNASPLASWCRDNRGIDKGIPINEQLTDYDSELLIAADHLEIGGYRVNTFSVKRYPEYIYFGNAASYAADVLTGTRGIFTPFIITGTIHYPEVSSLRSSINTRRQWVVNQAYGPLLKFEPKLAVKKQGFDLLYQEMENGSRPLKFNLTVTTFCRDEREAVSTVSALRTYYKELGFEVMPDKYYILPIFLNSLPFGTDLSSFNSLMRFRTLCSPHVLPLLPVFADSRGTGTGVVNLFSRSGQLMNLSLYDSSTNYNLCIAAQSGSGKSFLVNEIIVSYLARGALCYVIDVGRSYEKLCSFLGGRFLSFGIDSEVSLNPFECVRDYADEADMINGLLAIMAAPTEKLTDFQNAELKRITGELFKIHGNSLTIDLVADTLNREEDPRVSDLGRQLYSFTSAGEYGRFFSGHNNIEFREGGFTVLELEELKGRRHLQQVVLLQLIYQIQQNMYLGERNRPKIIIIDEAWDLLRDGDVARFIETGYRRFRKYGGAAVTVTQSVNDLYSSEVGMAIAENSANMYLLGQKAETINILEQEKRLPLTGGEYEFLRSVHTLSGVYSEIFVISDRGNAVGRLVVDPFRKLLYSTRAEEVNAIEKLVRDGCTVAEAITRILDSGDRK